jgi:hypothetical protein
MDKSNIIKGVVQGVVGFGAGKIIKDVIKHNTSPESKIDVVTYAAGSFALGGIVSEAAKGYIDRRFESVISGIEKARLKAEQVKNDADAIDAVEKAKENPLDPEVVAKVAQTVKDRLNQEPNDTGF